MSGVVLTTGSRSFTYDDRIHVMPVDRLWHAVDLGTAALCSVRRPRRWSRGWGADGDGSDYVTDVQFRLDGSRTVMVTTVFWSGMGVNIGDDTSPDSLLDPC